jgi:DNA polymerase-3 subunit epsilon
VSHTWGRPAREADNGWVVVDVETSGFRPGQARVLSIAALALDPDGNVEHSVVSLLNPGVDPGPTHVHGLTAEMLEDQPSFADIAADVADLMHGADDLPLIRADAPMPDALDEKYTESDTVLPLRVPPPYV